jgi:hypothetical protein
MFLAPAVLIGLVVGLLLGGRLSRLAELRLRAQWLFFAAIGLQAGVALPLVPLALERQGHDKLTIGIVAAAWAIGMLATASHIPRLAARFGAVPFIPFKSNTTEERGGLWAELFRHFCEHRDTFMQRYHQRSNVESVFSAIKRKFGDSVRSKTDVAMVNEVLAKVIAHNICVVNQEMHELGIAGRFWDDDVVPDDGPKMVLQFRRPG